MQDMDFLRICQHLTLIKMKSNVLMISKAVNRWVSSTLVQVPSSNSKKKIGKSPEVTHTNQTFYNRKRSGEKKADCL
uniref:Uncharacterized protein n=1 Tax=Arundo donax TaxID=35708 RepID=A0A0A9FJR9_ARUDO